MICGGWLHGGMAVASLDGDGRPMAHGVRDTAAAVSDDGAAAFIAPMPERADSDANGFHACYLRHGGTLRALCWGYERELAESPLAIYSKTTGVRLAASRDFSRFAAVVEFVKTGSTVGGVVRPTTLGVKLVVVDGEGNPLAEAELAAAEGAVPARQCHVSFSDDGKLLAACGQYLGLRLYGSPATDLTSFTTLDVGYTTGTAVVTGDGSKVFFPRDGASRRAVCYWDAATGAVVETGLAGDVGISDAQLAVSHDGSVVAFRKTAGGLSIAVLEDGAWGETVVEGTQIRSPTVSADGRYVVYQTRGTSCFQIMEYDRQKGASRLVSKNDGGAEADADCTSPSISADGSRIAFVSAASNLVEDGDGQPQLFVVEREAPSFTLELKRGWNLCGTPLTLDGQSVELLKGEGACWEWRDGRFRLPESFQAGRGFWIYALEDKTLRLTGEEAEPAPLKRGWNLALPSLYPEIELAKCFGFDGKAYVKLSEEANRSQAVWVLR